MHYRRFKLYGDPLSVAVRGGECSVKGCERPLIAAGLCTLHYQRAQRHGDTSYTAEHPGSYLHGHRYGGENGKESPTHMSWRAMLRRVTNPNDSRFKDYGGRGIAVCDRWTSFVNFLADMGERPEGLTLDRRDVNGNYEPSNCKWSTRAEQSRNQRRTRARVV